MTRSQSASSLSTNGPTLSQPALLTRTSMRPNFSVTAATIVGHRFLAGDVDPQADGAAAEFLRGGLGGLLVDVGDHDGGALGGEFLGDAAADAAAGAGDDRDLVVKLAHEGDSFVSTALSG